MYTTKLNRQFVNVLVEKHPDMNAQRNIGLVCYLL